MERDIRTKMQTRIDPIGVCRAAGDVGDEPGAWRIHLGLIVRLAL